jgi:hypothetical protein
MSSQGAKSGRSLLVAFLGFAAGATVANIYYSQPSLHAISTHFHSSAMAPGLFSAFFKAAIFPEAAPHAL